LSRSRLHASVTRGLGSELLHHTGPLAERRARVEARLSAGHIDIHNTRTLRDTRSPPRRLDHMPERRGRAARAVRHQAPKCEEQRDRSGGAGLHSALSSESGSARISLSNCNLAISRSISFTPTSPF